MAKASEPKKPAAKAAPAKASAAKSKGRETPANSEATPAPTKSATGADNQSQSERAKALFEKLHGTSAQRNAGGPPGSQGKKGGFDPKQFSGGKGNLGGAHNQMMRRTQGRGGGGGGGGGGSQV